MFVETELKLHIAPEHLIRLKRHALLKKISATPNTTRKLYSVYYDTPDLELHRRKMALRLRRVGRQWVQTLKGGGGGLAGLHQRNEWESHVVGKSLDFDVLDGIVSKLLPLAVREKLQPLFVTDFTRSSRIVVFDGAEIELCLDSGEVRAGQVSHSISEMELELKSGAPEQLFKLALELIEIVPLEIEYTSKAEYGYSLNHPPTAQASKANFPSLANCSSVSSALQNMISSCMQHFQANVVGVIKNLDEEYLHQLRVALRRLRVVLSMAEVFRADIELGELNMQVAELCIDDVG